MKNSKKIILVMLSIIGVIALLVGSIAYYRIVVNGSIKGSTGNAVFVLRDSDNSVWDNKVIDLGKINPGDSGEFTITMDASGSTVDMYATLEIERTNLPTNLKFYTTSDHKSELHKYYSFLEKNGTNSETLTIYWYWNPYIDDIEDSKFINVSNLEANVRVSAVQISEYAMMKNGYNYSTGGTEFWNNTYKGYIRTITFGNDLSNLPSSCTEENLCWDISYSTSQKKKVYGYLIDSGLTVSETDSSTNTTTEKPLYNLYIVSEAPIFAPANCLYIFSDFKNLMQINFNNNFNTSKVTNMYSMFYDCSSLISLHLDNFNTPKVTSMYSMFSYCSFLINLHLDNFNTSKVTNMNGMFHGCKSLIEIVLDSFNTSSVTNMNEMFSSCSSLTKLDLSSFDTSKVTSMGFMFYGCKSLIEIVSDSFNTSNVTNMCDMFEDCSSLASLDLSNFNTSNVTDMDNMFSGCYSLTSLNLSNFNTSKVTDMHNMFTGCLLLINLDLSNFNTSNVTDMRNMFYDCSSLISLDLSSFNTSNVTDMSRMFYLCPKLQTKLNIVGTSTTSYTEMFTVSLTDANAYVILGYTTDTQSIAEAMKATATNQSKITLKQI